MRIRSLLSAVNLVIAGLAAGCVTETVGPPPAPPVDWGAFEAGAPPARTAGPTAKEQAVAQAYVAAVSSPRFALLAARLDPAAHFAFPGMPGARGRDAVVHAHELLFGPFDARTMVATRVWRTDSAQAVEWTMSGRQTVDRDRSGLRADATLPALTDPVVFRGLTLLTTKDDGSIVDIHPYFDLATVAAQLSEQAKAPAPAEGLPRGGSVVRPPLPLPEAPKIYEHTGSIDEAGNVGIARGWLDALEGGREAAYLAAATDDVEVSTVVRPQPVRGKDDLRAYFRGMHKAISQLDTTVENIWGAGEFVIVEYSISGGQLGPVAGVAALGDRVLTLHLVDVLQLRGGQIARVWRYDDPSEIAAPPP